jgi:hypothetical protein
MKPNDNRAIDRARRFRTTHWSVVRLSAQAQVSSLRTVTDPRGDDEKIHAVCEALIPSEGQLAS